ncbi:MAG: GMC family oxidoreductase [Myxococcales bacterium]|nr:GMC family oxidoreductase [Myxococcales bacterium]
MQGPFDAAFDAFDPKEIYDAIVVGSGAAGGTAAYVLTAAGLRVLVLEAGGRMNVDEELRSTEWPYEHPRRGAAPYEEHSLGRNEYDLKRPPYAASLAEPRVTSYVGGSDYRTRLLVNEREHPYTGTPFAWVRARLLGGKTNIWGRLALRLSDLDFKAARHDGYGEDWPLSYDDVAPYYDRVDRFLGVAGHAEGLPYMPDGQFQTTPRLTKAELHLRATLARMGRVVTPYRAGVTTDGLAHNKYRSRCLRRGACHRKGGCDIHAAFDATTGYLYPALETGRLSIRCNAIAHEITVDPHSGKARGVSFVDAGNRKTYEARARVVVLAASTLESTRLLLLSRSRQHPNGMGNSSGHVGHNFCEHFMGPKISGMMRSLAKKERTRDDGRPGGFYVPRFRSLDRKHEGFVRGYGFEGDSGTSMLPRSMFWAKGFGKSFKKEVRDFAGAVVTMGGFGEVLPRFDNGVSLDPAIKDKWGIPVLKFNVKFGDNERAMAKDMEAEARAMFEAAGIDVLESSNRLLPAGWSIHELGTARMGTDPRTSVLNPFSQSHDVKNLFVMDGAGFVSAGSQNPTWTIMALAWRASDHLAEELRKGNL